MNYWFFVNLLIMLDVAVWNASSLCKSICLLYDHGLLGNWLNSYLYTNTNHTQILTYRSRYTIRCPSYSASIDLHERERERGRLSSNFWPCAQTENIFDKQLPYIIIYSHLTENAEDRKIRFQWNKRICN